MGEEPKVVEPNQPAGDEPKGSGGDEPRTYTQDDLDNITAKVKATAEKRAAELEAKLDSLRKASESEQEKAIREAREAAAQEVSAAKDAEIKRIRLEAALAREGLADEQAERLAKLAGDGDIADEVKALLTAPDTIRDIIRRGQYEEYRDRIEAARKAKIANSGMLVHRVK